MTNVRAAKLENRVYFAVPFVEKDRARRLGGQWDVEKGAWFVQDGASLENFACWQRLDSGKGTAARDRDA